MYFYSVRDLRAETKNLWDNLSAGGEVVFCHAPLITKNTKHYPQDSCITTVADFYQLYF